MNNLRKHKHRGATLMESVLSIGVLAVTVPMILAAIGESGRTGEASGAETRAPWMAAACFDELRAASLGRSEYFSATADGSVKPPADGIWALGFNRSGALVDQVSAEQYEAGTRDSGGRAIRFIARAHPAPANSPTTNSSASLPAMRVTVEYPATAPANRRRTLDFHAHIR